MTTEAARAHLGSGPLAAAAAALRPGPGHARPAAGHVRRRRRAATASFSNGQVILNVFIDNGFLLVVAVGMTFVILTGGIDLSVGSVVALTAMVSASLLRGRRLAAVRGAAGRAAGRPVLGFVMGCVIHYFDIQPFIVTLAGMFLARGLCTIISTDVDPDHRPVLDHAWRRSRIRFAPATSSRRA